MYRADVAFASFDVTRCNSPGLKTTIAYPCQINTEDWNMKNLLAMVVLVALGGCAVDQPSRGPYGNTVSAQPRDPSQWRVVSVTPVAAGTAARVAARSADGKPVEFSSAPVTVAPPYYAVAPVYAPAPVYMPQPAYYWPPVTLSLGFVFGRHWSRGHRGGHFRRHH